MKTIFVLLEGGLVQDVRGIPEGYEIKVLDFDVDGAGVEDVQHIIDPLNPTDDAAFVSTHEHVPNQKGTDIQIIDEVPPSWADFVEARKA